MTRSSTSVPRSRLLFAAALQLLRRGHLPRQLSGGQEQRAAIARGIVADPKRIVADEPTGDLDRQSADEILHLLHRLNRGFNQTIILVTHDPAAAERADRICQLDQGALA